MCALFSLNCFNQFNEEKIKIAKSEKSQMCSWKISVLLFQTTRIEFDLPDYCVRRRYQDFDWLRMKLEDTQPTHLIPVSPTSSPLSCFPNKALLSDTPLSSSRPAAA